MKKVLLIDYYGICDKEGRAVGHSPKVLEEYRELVEDVYEVSVAASPCLIEGAGEQFCDKYRLKYNICSEGRMSLGKRIKDKFMLFSNINQVLKIGGYDIYWFYKTDFFLFFYFCFHNMHKRKRSAIFMAQIYQAGFDQGRLGKILNWFYRTGMMKFDGIMYAQKEMAGLHSNMLYFPDYYYDPKKYKKYEKCQKEEKVVCLGTMNTNKKLGELMDAFRCNGYPLEIRGYFYDKNFYQDLRKKLSQNVILEDKILTEEEYYTTLAGAKYTVLPYDMKQYQCRTSGVLIESLFLNTTAIAPKQLLLENQIDGIGYDRIEELKNPSIFKKPPVLHNSAVKKEFDREEIRRRLKEFISESAGRGEKWK